MVAELAKTVACSDTHGLLHGQMRAEHLLLSLDSRIRVLEFEHPAGGRCSVGRARQASMPSGPGRPGCARAGGANARDGEELARGRDVNEPWASSSPPSGRGPPSVDHAQGQGGLPKRHRQGAAAAVRPAGPPAAVRAVAAASSMEVADLAARLASEYNAYAYPSGASGSTTGSSSPGAVGSSASATAAALPVSKTDSGMSLVATLPADSSAPGRCGRPVRGPHPCLLPAPNAGEPEAQSAAPLAESTSCTSSCASCRRAPSSSEAAMYEPLCVRRLSDGPSTTLRTTVPSMTRNLTFFAPVSPPPRPSTKSMRGGNRMRQSNHLQHVCGTWTAHCIGRTTAHDGMEPHTDESVLIGVGIGMHSPSEEVRLAACVCGTCTFMQVWGCIGRKRTSR